MSDPLTLARFQELAEAYGGVVAHWPQPYRDDALAMASQPDACKILAEAALLDEALDVWRIAAPSALLRQRIVDSAPLPIRRIVTQARLWWSGIGIVAALAGATAGIAAVAIAAPVDVTSDNSTSFGYVAGPET